ncbi:hypothetical protein [Pontibacter anaerobius]|uniref:Poly-beta-1,6-N-acetyl-D-glucosamine biosynthesis protein PgaD n=1 Tax=Pontibacter anaerobius TaxID=2993940 RepID=A0ABT3RG59_9BACT|nr:hypothetical protein [Pontibacter anaerobius]MCX2740813.1 hypothetical protein [Pontibacter anaerobius]
MRNYTLMRFVRLNSYFFAMYSVLTAIWYGLSGKFSEGESMILIQEIGFNAAVFSVLFIITMLVLYRRTEVRVPVKKYSPKQLQQRLEDVGFVKADSKKQPRQVYKPTPPKASALAGNVFVQQTANFWLLEGPKKFIGKLEA